MQDLQHLVDLRFQVGEVASIDKLSELWEIDKTAYGGSIALLGNSQGVVAFLSTRTENTVFRGSDRGSHRDLAAIRALRQAVGRGPHKRVRDHGQDDAREKAGSLLVYIRHCSEARNRRRRRDKSVVFSRYWIVAYQG